ncbi:YraN family protein [Luteococcus sanguinis]|uniref:UPF0102 protein ACFP57_02325 n=1 Tax=Luteococcus sanguinis TaxID=174038 RepID=A0ABW1WX53_9ACTN
MDERHARPAAQLVAPDRQETGRYGEDLAHGYLHRLGWQVVERNWRCARGEIDIVALEPLPSGGRCIVFVEVKCRRGRGYGDPLEAVTRNKVRKLVELSQLWLREHDLHAEQIRIDAIGVLHERGRNQVHHVRGVTR